MTLCSSNKIILFSFIKNNFMNNILVYHFFKFVIINTLMMCITYLLEFELLIVT